MEWSVCKSSTISPAALFSVFGRARRIGRKNGGNGRAKLNSWNGANGSRCKSRIIEKRDLTFRRTRARGTGHHELGNDRGGRATGSGLCRDSVLNLPGGSNSRTDQRTETGCRPRAHRTMVSADRIAAQQSRDGGDLSPRRRFLQRSGFDIETPLQRVFQSSFEHLRRNVLLTCATNPDWLIMARHRANDDRSDCLSWGATMVGSSETLAYRRI